MIWEIVSMMIAIVDSDVKRIPVPVDVHWIDAWLHTPDKPFCSKENCACHFDHEYMDQHFVGPVARGELRIDQALDLYHCGNDWRLQ